MFDEQDMLATVGRSKRKLISDVLLWTSTHEHTSVGRPAKTYIHQLCADTACSLENLPEVMGNMDGWRVCVCVWVRERLRENSVLPARFDDEYIFI